jgi:hypothetical protein
MEFFSQTVNPIHTGAQAIHSGGGMPVQHCCNVEWVAVIRLTMWKHLKMNVGVCERDLTGLIGSRCDASGAQYKGNLIKFAESGPNCARSSGK